MNTSEFNSIFRFRSKNKFCRNVIDRRASGQGHGEVELALQDVQRSGDAVFTVVSKAPKDGTTDKDHPIFGFIGKKCFDYLLVMTKSSFIKNTNRVEEGGG